MDSLERACVSLLVNDDELDPAKISELLCAEPDRGVRKGEVFLSSRGKPTKAKTGMWHVNGQWETPPDLNRQIAILLGGLTADPSAWRELRIRHGICYLSVGGYLLGWTGGMTLQPTTLHLLAERMLPIDFDLYAPAASD